MQNPPLSNTTVPANVSTVLRKEEEQSLERRPSWRLRVDDSDRSKFSLEDTRNPVSRPASSTSSTSIGHHGTSDTTVVQRSPSLRKSNKHESSSPSGLPPRPPLEDKDMQVDDDKASPAEKDSTQGGAQGAILRKKKQKRRSTGVVQYNTDVSFHSY